MASPLDMLLNKVKEEPVVFLFLGATMAALGGGLRTLATGDKRQSQLMMRARVFFQLCTVTTLAGTIYWKAYTGETRAWLTHQFDSFSFALPILTLAHLPIFYSVMGQRRTPGQKLPDYLTDSRLLDAVEGSQCAVPNPTLKQAELQ